MSNKGVFLQYTPRNFNAASLNLIGAANQIIDEYRAQGLLLTLRQIYYQFVDRKILPNVPKSYSQLGRLINQGRLAGLVSWDAIEDRTRNLMGLETWKEPSDAISAMRKRYKRDLWSDQPFRPEVWIEKEALANVVEGICAEMRVDFFAQRGYNSQSEQWRAGQRFARYINKGQRPIIFHLGDHDPSGLDMTRDNRERLEMFVGVPVQVVRLALNISQIEQYDLPPDPAKVTDSRAEAYIAEFGPVSWELDALNPTILRELIRDAVWRLRDDKKWDAALAEEAEDLRYLDDLIREGPGGGDDQSV